MSEEAREIIKLASVLESWYQDLDRIRILYQNAEEEYCQLLDEFEAEFGFNLREEYEEKYV